MASLHRLLSVATILSLLTLAACAGASAANDSSSEQESDVATNTQSPDSSFGDDLQRMSVADLKGNGRKGFRIGDPAPEGGAAAWRDRQGREVLVAFASGPTVECVSWFCSFGAPAAWLGEAGIQLGAPVALLRANFVKSLLLRATNRPGLYVATDLDAMDLAANDRFFGVVRATDEAALQRLQTPAAVTRLDVYCTEALFADLDRAITKKDDGWVRIHRDALAAGARIEPTGRWATRLAESAVAAGSVVAAAQEQKQAELAALTERRAKDWPKLSPLAQYLRLRDDLFTGNRLARQAGLDPWPEEATLQQQAAELRRTCSAAANNPPRSLEDAFWLWDRRYADKLPEGNRDTKAYACHALATADGYQSGLKAYEAVTDNLWKLANGDYVDPVVAATGPHRLLAGSALANAVRREAQKHERANQPLVAGWWRKGVADWIEWADAQNLQTKWLFYPKQEEIDATLALLAPFDAELQGSKVSPFGRLHRYPELAAKLEQVEAKQPWAKDHVRDAGSRYVRDAIQNEAGPLRTMAEAAKAKGLRATAAWLYLCALRLDGTWPDSDQPLSLADLVALNASANPGFSPFFSVAMPLLAELAPPIATESTAAATLVAMQCDDVVPKGLVTHGLLPRAGEVVELRARLRLPPAHLFVRRGADGTAELVELPALPTLAEQFPAPSLLPGQSPELEAERAAAIAESEAVKANAARSNAEAEKLMKESEDLLASYEATQSRLEELYRQRESMSPEAFAEARNRAQYGVDLLRKRIDEGNRKAHESNADWAAMRYRIIEAGKRRGDYNRRLAEYQAEPLVAFDTLVRPLFEQYREAKFDRWAEQRRKELPAGPELQYELECAAFFAGVGTEPNEVPFPRTRATTALELAGHRSRLERARDAVWHVRWMGEILTTAARGPIDPEAFETVAAQTIRLAETRELEWDLKHYVEVQFPPEGLEKKVPDLLKRFGPDPMGQTIK